MEKTKEPIKETVTKAVDVEALKKKLEKQAEDEIKQKGAGFFIKNGDQCIALMEKGAQEFVEKTGRNMTYSEIREMYG